MKRSSAPSLRAAFRPPLQVSGVVLHDINCLCPCFSHPADRCGACNTRRSARKLARLRPQRRRQLFRLPELPRLHPSRRPLLQRQQRLQLSRRSALRRSSPRRRRAPRRPLCPRPLPSSSPQATRPRRRPRVLPMLSTSRSSGECVDSRFGSVSSHCLPACLPFRCKMSKKKVCVNICSCCCV
jgi:hypothetical protein